ncbi:hypothetical protein HZ994_18635 [Akkermansiaceae bacterium]|nr:hypothetical protein HZ994_18635 [Akkermansiaceae bacterium]
MLIFRRQSACMLAACALAAISCGEGLLASEVMSNPIGKVARLFNPKLVKMEDRVEFLNRQLISLAAHEEKNLRYGVGCRGARKDPTDAPPSLTVDLGRDFPIDTLFLIPLQSGEGGSIFPKAFKIELSSDAGFSEHRVLYDTGRNIFPDTGGKPVKFSGQGAVARYVRITVWQGSLRGRSEVFGLSELVVISGGFPVSFGCEVSDVGGLRVENMWYPEALTDGRMPLGSWEGGNWADGMVAPESFEVHGVGQAISWGSDFGKTEKLDLLILFPMEIHGMLEASVIPEKLEVRVLAEDEVGFTSVRTWEAPFKGGPQDVPFVLDLGGVSAKAIQINGLEASMVGQVPMFGLSEIQVWADGINIVKGRKVTRSFAGDTADVDYLTDGFASAREIIPVGSWLTQLHDRWRLEREIEALRPMQAQMASESELNATWGSAMMLGLTFLIPVFIVERRRLISRNQIDELRKRIASDLHDDIGSNLGSISLIARTARKDLVRQHGPEGVSQDLGEVESIARESSLAMRDIVWLLERKQDSIGDLVHRMRETATRLLREVDYSIECDSGKAAAKLSLDAKRHLFLFYKEAVHNILKHSGATSVSIRLWDEGDKLALEVIDNGKGLPKVVVDGKEVTKTVRKLDERARVLEGDLVMQTEPGKGTRILLMVKRSLLIAAPNLK